MQISRLTPREKQCLQGIFAGKSNREIGNDIGISEGTVKNHLKVVYEKLGIHNTRHLFPLVIAANRELRTGSLIEC